VGVKQDKASTVLGITLCTSLVAEARSPQTFIMAMPAAWARGFAHSSSKPAKPPIHSLPVPFWVIVPLVMATFFTVPVAPI